MNIFWIKPPNIIDAIMILNQVCNFLPIGFEKFFLNIKLLWIESLNFTSISCADISLFLKLNRLRNNSIKVLPQNVFGLNPSIEWIELTDNKIVYVHPNVLDCLKNLTTVSFLNNECISSKNSMAGEIDKLKLELIASCRANPSETNTLISKIQREISELSSQERLQSIVYSSKTN
jgi:Leucine rich repeat